jgi:lysozyme family protein
MNIETAIQKTLVHEGGYVNNPNDKGGPTKFGITQADLPGEDIAMITPQRAAAYYREHYVKPLYPEIADQLLGEKLFDMGVLFGVGTAVKLLQITMTTSLSVVSDGVFGPSTLAAVNQSTNLLQPYRTTLINHCIQIVNRNPGDAVFIQGWLNRINS